MSAGNRCPQQQILDSLFESLQQHFYKPDLQALRIVLGTIQAHFLNIGDPAWLFVVAPAGTGKTTISIMGASDLEEVILLSDVSENTFLSGFYGHPHPGLLEKIGKSNRDGATQITTGNLIVLIKDFTTVLSMRREKRGAILSQLREIHDGLFKRDFGTGETKIWRGQATVIAAVTPVLDRHYSIFTTLGERFLQVRWHRPDSEEAGEWAILQQGHEAEIKEQIGEAVLLIFENALKEGPTLSADMRKRIAALAEVVALCRTHVFRNGYGNREIEYVPEPEANTRIAKQLVAIARGIASLNGHTSVTEEEFQDVLRVAFDCIPDARRRLLEATRRGQSPSQVPMAAVVRARELQELEALGILEPDAQTQKQQKSTLLAALSPEPETDRHWNLTSNVKRLLTTAGVTHSRCVRDKGL